MYVIKYHTHSHICVCMCIIVYTCIIICYPFYAGYSLVQLIETTERYDSV